jgi:hypothetical protein
VSLHYPAKTVTIELRGANVGAEARALRTWLLKIDDLEADIAVAPRRPSPEALGHVADALVVALAPGGVTAVLIGGIFGWLRHRTSDLSVSIRQPDGGQAEISAHRVQRLNAEELATAIALVVQQLDDPDYDAKDD